MSDIWNSISTDRYVSWVLGGARILFLIGVGYLLTVLTKRLLRAVRNYAVGLMLRRGDELDSELEKRATTIVTVIRRPLMLIIWAAILLTILRELNIEIGPLLAGLGLGVGAVGVAVGLGAQPLIKDMIGGVFLLMENQIRVHDVAVINGTSGSVEEINLRTTVLRSENGAVHVFPNGSIQSLSNLTRDFSYFVLTVDIDIAEEPERAIAAIREVASELRSNQEYGAVILDNLDVYGVDRLGNGSTTVKARLKTLPMKQWWVGREFNRRLRLRIQADQIRWATPTNVIRLDPSASPLGRMGERAV